MLFEFFVGRSAPELRIFRLPMMIVLVKGLAALKKGVAKRCSAPQKLDHVLSESGVQ